MERVKILYVDDEETNLINFNIAFGREYEVIAIDSGYKALDILKKERDIAIVLADQRMPEMSGVELLEQVYRMNQDPVRMIFTGYRDVNEILEAVNRGHVYGYILKTAKEGELRLALSNARETYWLNRENRRLLCDLEEKNIAVQKINEELRTVNDLLARDIMKRKVAEEHIRNLTQELIKVQENERQKISLDLHDNVAQDLSSLKIGCETIFDDFPSVPEELRDRVLNWSRTLQKCITTVRNLSYDLRPPSLEYMGLFRTVHQYCSDFCRDYGLSLDLHAVGMEDLKLDYGIEITLYRLIQEVLNNIKNHAEAKNVTVKLVASYPLIILRIEDDGKGFDVPTRLAAARNERRMGIQGMEERVKLLHGTIKIQSRPQEGTRIMIEVPYKEKKDGIKQARTHH